MGRSWGSWAAAVALVGVWLGGTVAQDKTSSPDRTGAKDKYVPAGELTGKLTRVETDQKLIAVQVQVPYLNGRNVALRGENVELMLADDVKVRLLNPPLEFDEKGRPRRPSAKRLRELRGTSKLPGYQADLDSLKVEQVVTVSLKRLKEKSRPGARKEAAAEHKPVVSLILVLKEPVKQ